MSIILFAVALQGASTFDATSAAFSACMVQTVRMGMTTKMPPAQFEIGFAISCKTEEAAFRADAIKRAIELGRTPKAAAIEVDSNIANARRIFVRDEATYVTTGRIPR